MTALWTASQLLENYRVAVTGEMDWRLGADTLAEMSWKSTILLYSPIPTKPRNHIKSSQPPKITRKYLLRELRWPPRLCIEAKWNQLKHYLKLPQNPRTRKRWSSAQNLGSISCRNPDPEHLQDGLCLPLSDCAVSMKAQLRNKPKHQNLSQNTEEITLPE